MALSKNSIEKLAKIAGMTSEALTEAIQDKDEKDVEINVEKTFTADEWEQYETNLATEKQTKYEEGKTAGQEMTIKALKNESGLEFTGKNTGDFIENFKKKILKDADKDPDKKVAELENDLKVLREETLVQKETEINQLKSQLTSNRVDGSIRSSLPSKLPAGLTQDDALTIIKNNLEFGFDAEGKEVVKKGGETLKDKTRSNIGFKDAISDFVVERNWTTGTGGRGGNDEPGGKVTDYKKIRKISELNEYFEEKGINPKGQEANAILSEVNKAAKDAGEELEFDVE